MKSVYKDYLFDKHFFVNDLSGQAMDDSEQNQFETLFALANLFGIRILKGEKLVSRDMIRYAAERLGENVPEPFYIGFPQSVRELTADKLLYDQLISYIRTYGVDDFSEAKHSLFEERFERTAFKENVDIKEFVVLDEKRAEAEVADSVNDLLRGTRPLSDEQYELIRSFIIDYKTVPDKIASKNTAIKLLLDLRDLSFVSFISMSDIIKLVDELNYAMYENTNIKKLNLKNQDRKFITSVIDQLFETGRVDIRSCCEKKKIWNGLLHHIHYKAKSKEAQLFLDVIRGNDNISVYSEFEKSMTEKNIQKAVEALKAGKGSAAVLRNLNYIISRCENIEDMEQIISSIDTSNVIVLIQILIQYSQYKSVNYPRTFKFSKYNKMKVHTETEAEQRRRKTVLSEEVAEKLARKISDNLAHLLSNRLGKVYIDPDMKRYALPIQENTSQGGFGVLTKGSKIKIPDAQKLRAFTYWEKVDDIDLSTFGITDKGEKKEFSWRTMAGLQSNGITYSGDVTSGYNGGSEYFDIDIEKFKAKYPDIHYLIFCNNVYSGSCFNNCYCKAGYMIRSVEDSGEIYEPKTVKSSFIIDCSSTFAYLFGVDLRTRDFVWLNISRDSSTTVAGITDMSFLTDYFHVTEIINVYTFFEMMASEVVSDISEAEIVVTDKNVECAENIQVIREYDIDKMLALMNQ